MQLFSYLRRRCRIFRHVDLWLRLLRYRVEAFLIRRAKKLKAMLEHLRKDAEAGPGFICGIYGHEWTQAKPFAPWRCKRCNARPGRVAK